MWTALLSQDIMHGSNTCVFFLNSSHLLKKKPGYSPGRLFLRNFVCIWPIKLTNKLRKITQYDTRSGFGCDCERSALKPPLERASTDWLKKTCRLLVYIFVTMQQWPDEASDNSVNFPEMRAKVLDQRQHADEMCWCEALWEREREKTHSWITHTVFKWLI